MDKTSCFGRVDLVMALLVALVPGFAQAETVGMAGAINPRSSGRIETRPAKVIEIGEQIVRDEKIETSPTGSVQIVFIDKTTLNIGPNSSIVIDRFVFDPATSTGSMALTLGRGVLRLVGGQATHTGGATIGTPAATIGVRGGIATISHCAETGPCGPAGTLAINHFGVISVSAGGVTEEILRPGFGVRVAIEAGATPSTPARVTQAEIDGANALLTSHGTQRGGAKHRPSDILAATNGLGHANRNVTPVIAARQPQTQTTTSPASATDIVNSVEGTIQQGVAQSAAAASRRLRASAVPLPLMP